MRQCKENGPRKTATKPVFSSIASRGLACERFMLSTGMTPILIHARAPPNAYQAEKKL